MLRVSEEDELQAFGQKEGDFMEEVIPKLRSMGKVALCAVRQLGRVVYVWEIADRGGHMVGSSGREDGQGRLACTVQAWMPG